VLVFHVVGKILNTLVAVGTIARSIWKVTWKASIRKINYRAVKLISNVF